MKKLIFILNILPFLIYSCDYNKSLKKDLKNGTSISENNLSCEKIEIEINGKIQERNELIYGEEINFIFNNVKGLTKINNKYFPALSMTIIKNKKDTVYFENNLMKDYINGIEKSPINLNAFFIAALPNKNNEKYEVHIIISDKKGKGNMAYSFPFTVKENNLLKIRNNNLSYSNIYIWDKDEKKVISNNNIKQTNTLMLMIEGVEGFLLKDKNAFPILSLELLNANGRVIISDENILNSYFLSGVDSETLKSQVSAEVKFTDGTLVNPYKLKVVLKDKNSSNQLEIKTEINVEK